MMVMGVGGAGLRIVDQIHAQQFGAVRTVAIDSHAQALTETNASMRLLIGANGLGAGGNPVAGHEAAHSSAGALHELLTGVETLVLVAGMAGGTGGGATPVIAHFAMEREIEVAAVVTMPLALEGADRRRSAERNLSTLQGQVKQVHVVEGERVVALAGQKQVDLQQVFAWIDRAAAWQVLLNQM